MAQLSPETLARMAEILGRVEDGSQIARRFAEMRALEEQLRSLLDRDINAWLATLPEEARHAAEQLYDSGGKRLRPVFALLCAGAVSGSAELALPVAAAVELLHTGTLLHDDVVDEGEIRRGRPTARRVWGNALAVLSGDFCYFAALDALIDFGDLALLDRAMAVARALSEGELIQLQRRGVARLDGEAEYFQVIERKTASLFAFATWGGGRCAGADEATLKTLDEFGNSLGLAFQIVDDILDFAGDAEVFGKALGHDVAEGTVTLPLAYAMEVDPILAADVQRLVSDFSDGRDSEVDPAEIVRKVRSSPGLERARTKAQTLTSEAMRHLRALPESEFRSVLELLTASLLDRVS